MADPADEDALAPSAFTPYNSGDDGAPRAPAGDLDPDRPEPCTVRATAGLVRMYQVSNPAFEYTQAHNPKRVLTRPDEPAHNQGYDNEDHDYILHVGDVLEGPENERYCVLDMLGTGTFGQVVKCHEETSDAIVAVKVIKNQPAYYKQALMELYILDILKKNVTAEEKQTSVRLLGYFVFRHHLCIVFEKLSINLFELLKQNGYRGVGIDLVRHFANQILVTLRLLERCAVIHCDLKPENILLQSLESTDIKVIDFGSACPEKNVVYSYVQSRFYRSPEVLLAAPYNTKIDVWSLGCVLGEMFLGLPLFPGQSEQNMIVRIVEMLGLPDDSFLDRCELSTKYFNDTSKASGAAPRGKPSLTARVDDNFSLGRSNSSPSIDLDVGTARGGARFVLKSDEEYGKENKATVEPWKRYFKKKHLKDIVMAYPVYSTDYSREEEDSHRECFADLLFGLLQLDPEKRWSANEASEHPFLKGEPLPNGEPWSPPRKKKLAKPAFFVKSAAAATKSSPEPPAHPATAASVTTPSSSGKSPAAGSAAEATATEVGSKQTKKKGTGGFFSAGAAAAGDDEGASKAAGKVTYMGGAVKAKNQE